MGPYATNAFVRSARASVNKRLEERERECVYVGVGEGGDGGGLCCVCE